MLPSPPRFPSSVAADDREEYRQQAVVAVQNHQQEQCLGLPKGLLASSGEDLSTA